MNKIILPQTTHRMGLSNVTQTFVLTSLVTAVSILGTLWYQKWKKAKIPTEWEKVATVKTLYLYPLKSGYRINFKEFECTKVGPRQIKEDKKVFLLRDRCFVVYVLQDSEFRTGRTYPKIGLINISAHDENHIAMSAPTMETLYVKIPVRGESNTTKIKIWQNERISGIDCGDEAASWLSRFLIEKDSGLRLGYNDAQEPRDITTAQQKVLNYYKNLGNRDLGLYADITSLLLINKKSVDDMNQRISNSTIIPEHFRPNLIIDGPDLEPYAEDKWDWMKIGDDVVVRNVKDCARCISIVIDPNTVERHPQREPLRTLETYRQHNGPEKGPIMGSHLGVYKTGIVRVGDPVYIAKQPKS